jgi:hypothetical protein
MVDGVISNSLALPSNIIKNWFTWVKTQRIQMKYDWSWFIFFVWDTNNDQAPMKTEHIKHHKQ